MKASRVVLGSLIAVLTFAFTGCANHAATQTATESSPNAAGATPSFIPSTSPDGDPVGHRNYSQIGSQPSLDLAKRPIRGIPRVCIQQPHACKWYVDFETSANSLSDDKFKCVTVHCIRINEQMTRTEEDENGQETGSGATYYVRATISAQPPAGQKVKPGST